MSSEDAPSPSTYRDHLLSRSLFRELFRHNLVGPDGRMKDNPDNMKKYLSFLEKMAAERRTALYEKRNQLVREADRILKIRDPHPNDQKRLKAILDELELGLTDEVPVPTEFPKIPRRYLGSSEPKMSIYEKRLFEDIRRNKILKRDLKVLDDWLEEISTPFAKVVQIRPYKPCLTWKEFQRNHHARVKKRVADMEQSRRNLIKNIYSFNENAIRKLFATRTSSERKSICIEAEEVLKSIAKDATSDAATCASDSSLTTEDIFKSSMENTES